MTGGPTWHGGRLSEARAAHGEAGQPWLDLSTGINPRAWNPDAVEIDWRSLPDEAGLDALEAAAAAHFGVDPAFVAALPGTEIGLRLLGGLLPGKPHHVAPTYRTHAAMFAGSTAIALTERGLPAGVVVLANPNNPDGRVLAEAEMLDRLSGQNGWLVIDEAFADATPGCSLAAHVADGRRLVVFRSFGKFFGLAGLRLGFVLGPRDLLAAVRDRLGAWPVSAAAIAIGTAAYRDHAWIAATRGRLAGEAARLDGVLRRHGFAPRGDCPLFRLIETDDAHALFERLARRAILTRPFDYDSRWLRLGLTGDGLARLDAALTVG